MRVLYVISMLKLTKSIAEECYNSDLQVITLPQPKMEQNGSGIGKRVDNNPFVVLVS